MTDNAIIKALECICSYNVSDGGYLAKDALDLINRQQEQLEATIAGQESLQKLLAEKDREVSVLNSDLKLLKNNHEHLRTNFDETVEKNKRLRDKVVGLTAEKDRLIETFGECQAEAVREFAERLKEALPMECRTVVEGNDMEGITDTGFQEDDTMTTIDNLVKEMAGDTE